MVLLNSRGQFEVNFQFPTPKPRVPSPNSQAPSPNPECRAASAPQNWEVAQRADVRVEDGASDGIPAGRHAVGQRPAWSMRDVEDGVCGERECEHGEGLMWIPHQRG